jgi:hypothetical protein
MALGHLGRFDHAPGCQVAVGNVIPESPGTPEEGCGEAPLSAEGGLFACCGTPASSYTRQACVQSAGTRKIDEMP